MSEALSLAQLRAAAGMLPPTAAYRTLLVECHRLCTSARACPDLKAHSIQFLMNTFVKNCDPQTSLLDLVGFRKCMTEILRVGDGFPYHICKRWVHGVVLVPALLSAS
jgi:hypothetical protein